MAGTDRIEDDGASNRGTPARVNKDGSVTGSGAGAGGGGAPEDFDSDSAAGGGADIEPRAARAAHVGADAPKHGGA